MCKYASVFFPLPSEWPCRNAVKSSESDNSEVVHCSIQERKNSSDGMMRTGRISISNEDIRSFPFSTTSDEVLSRGWPSSGRLATLGLLVRRKLGRSHVKVSVDCGFFAGLKVLVPKGTETVFALYQGDWKDTACFLGWLRTATFVVHVLPRGEGTKQVEPLPAPFLQPEDCQCVEDCLVLAAQGAVVKGLPPHKSLDPASGRYKKALRSNYLVPRIEGIDKILTPSFLKTSLMSYRGLTRVGNRLARGLERHLRSVGARAVRDASRSDEPPATQSAPAVLGKPPASVRDPKIDLSKYSKSTLGGVVGDFLRDRARGTKPG